MTSLVSDQLLLIYLDFEIFCFIFFPLETSREMIESTGKSLLKSLVDAKQQLHVAAKDFDSEDAFRQGQENLAKAVNIAFQGTETLAKNLGVFESLNKIIHSLAEPLEKK